MTSTSGESESKINCTGGRCGITLHRMHNFRCKHEGWQLITGGRDSPLQLAPWSSTVWLDGSALGALSHASAMENLRKPMKTLWKPMEGMRKPMHDLGFLGVCTVYITRREAPRRKIECFYCILRGAKRRGKQFHRFFIGFHRVFIGVDRFS